MTSKKALLVEEGMRVINGQEGDQVTPCTGIVTATGRQTLGF